MVSLIEKALQEVQDRFTASSYPTPKQYRVKDRNLKLLEETRADQKQLPSSTRYTHEAAQRTLKEIRAKLGEEKFFFIIHALPMTTLQSTDTVFAEYEKWLSGKQFPSRFTAYAAEATTDLHIVSNSSTQRDNERHMAGDASQQVSSMRYHTPIHHSGVEAVRITDQNISGRPAELIMPDNEYEGREGDLDPLPADAPMTGAVYAIGRLATIKAIVNGQEPYTKLTIPNTDGCRPFIFVQCSELAAKELLEGSQRIM